MILVQKNLLIAGFDTAIVLIFADDNVKQIVSSRLGQSWPYGPDEPGRHLSDGSYEFLLKADPFSITINPQKTANLSLFLCELLIDLKSAGWRLIASTKDLSQPTAGSACSTLYFRSIDDNQPNDFVAVANENEIICACCASSAEPSNLVMLANAPDQFGSDLVDLIEPEGTCKLVSTKYRSSGVSILQFDQLLWAQCESLYSRRCILTIFDHFRSLGYRFYSTINFDGASDAIFFERVSISDASSNAHCQTQTQREAIVEEDEGEENEDMEVGEEEQDNQSSIEEISFPAFGPATASSSSVSSSSSSSSLTSPFFVMDAYKSNNRLRVLRAPLRIVFVIRSLISLRWPYGLRSATRVDSDAYEFVVGVESSNDETRSNAIYGNAAALLCLLLQTLRNNGWQLMASFDLSKHSDKWTFVFHEEPAAGGNRSGTVASRDKPTRQYSMDPPHRPDIGRVWCLCMSGPSTLTMLNARPQLKQSLSELIAQYWPRGVKNVVEFGGNRRIRMVGQPWRPSIHQQTFTPDTDHSEHGENEDLLSRSLLCILLSDLKDNFGCHSLCVASIAWKTASADRNQLSDTHCCWFFIDPYAVDVENGKAMENGPPTEPKERAAVRRSTIC